MKLRHAIATTMQARAACGQLVSTSVEACGEPVSFTCDVCDARVCFLHAVSSEVDGKDRCPACVERHRGVTFVALHGVFGARKGLSNEEQMRHVRAALSRLSRERPRRPRLRHRVVEALRRMWWFLWG